MSESPPPHPPTTRLISYFEAGGGPVKIKYCVRTLVQNPHPPLFKKLLTGLVQPPPPLSPRQLLNEIFIITMSFQYGAKLYNVNAFNMNGSLSGSSISSTISSVVLSFFLEHISFNFKETNLIMLLTMFFCAK